MTVYVKNLFIKSEPKVPLSAVDRLDLIAAFGIEGNINSDRLSPRQILVVDRQYLQQFAIPPGELRENIVLDLADYSQFKPGAKLCFASGAEIRLTFYCEPCKRIAHLVDSIEILSQKRGILGVAINSGAIALNDEVIIEPNCFAPLSEIPYERFLDYVKQIPKGKVVTYRQILRCIGVDKSYFRAIPIYLKKAAANYPLHRVVDSQGRITPHVFQQKELLEAEGIEVLSQVSCDRVAFEKYAWNHPLVR